MCALKYFLLLPAAVALCNAFSPVSDSSRLVSLEIRVGRAKLDSGATNAQTYANDLRTWRAKASISQDKKLLLQATADWIEAAAYNRLNKPATALNHDTHGLILLSGRFQNSFLFGELLLERGSALGLLNQVQGSITSYQQSYHVFERINSTDGMSLALINLAISYLDASDYANALKYDQRALEIGVPSSKLMFVFNNIGGAYLGQKDYAKAQASFRQAGAKALENRSYLLAAQFYDNVAKAQLDNNQVPAAEKSAAIAYQITNYKDAMPWRPVVYGTLAKLALQRGDSKRAEELLSHSLNRETAISDTPRLRELYDTAYRVYKVRGDERKALYYLELFRRKDDQIRALTASASAALVAARFDFANQDLKISRLRAGQAERDAALVRSQARFHTVLLSALSIISGLLAAGIFFLGRSRAQVQAANRSLQGSNAELERALAAKGEFLSTTSHEIRTPLNGILGMTQVLLADRGVPAPVRDRVELIHGAGETMRALVDDILDMAKMETGELRLHPAPMDLRRLLEQAGAVWAGQAETKRLRLVLDLDRCPHGIVADEVRLRQVVFNLMSNAIKFTDRGQVGLAAWTDERDGAERLLLRIDDSGIGIPADRLAEIFESFRQVDGGVTRRHGGTGLGLAICRNIARAMGGDVSVDSVLGAGSRFTVTLPLRRTSVEAGPAAIATAPAATLAEARLLLLEPNPLSQGILRALIAPRVAGLEATADCEGAATLLAAGGFHHLLADGAAFGLDAAAAVAFVAAQPVGRATLTWTQPDEAVRAALREAGVQLVAKPVSPADLLAALRMGYDAPQADRDIAA